MTGQSWTATEWNAIIDYLVSLTPRQTVGVLTDHTVSGVFRRAGQVVGGKGSSKIVGRYTLVSCPGTIDGSQHVTNGDYIIGRPIGGLGDGSQDVKVAKPYELWLSLTGVRELSVDYTFTYQNAITDTNNLQRTKTAGPTSEAQQVIPLWTVGSMFNAIAADTGVVDAGGIPVALLYIGAARSWAKVGDGT